MSLWCRYTKIVAMIKKITSSIQNHIRINVAVYKQHQKNNIVVNVKHVFPIFQWSKFWCRHMCMRRIDWENWNLVHCVRSEEMKVFSFSIYACSTFRLHFPLAALKSVVPTNIPNVEGQIYLYYFFITILWMIYFNEQLIDVDCYHKALLVGIKIMTNCELRLFVWKNVLISTTWQTCAISKLQQQQWREMCSYSQLLSLFFYYLKKGKKFHCYA